MKTEKTEKRICIFIISFSFNFNEIFPRNRAAKYEFHSMMSGAERNNSIQFSHYEYTSTTLTPVSLNGYLHIGV